MPALAMHRPGLPRPLRLLLSASLLAALFIAARDPFAPHCPLLPTAHAQQIAAGYTHTCAITAPAGTLRCWGLGASVQNVSQASGGFSQVSASRLQTIGLRDNGMAVAWGSTRLGPARQPPGNETFTYVSAGLDFACGVTLAGGMSCWGDPGWPNFASTAAPPSVAAHNWTMAVLWMEGLCALATTGQAVCWLLIEQFDWSHEMVVQSFPPAGLRFVVIGVGAMVHGILVNGTLLSFAIPGETVPTDDFPSLPSAVRSAPFSSMAGMTRFTCAIRIDQIAVCSGSVVKAHIAAPSSEHFMQLQVGIDFGVGVNADRSIVGYGDQSGFSDHNDNSPAGPAGALANIAMGTDWTCALRFDTGTISCFGDMLDVRTPSGSFSQLVSSATHNCAIRSDDRNIVCWGPAGVALDQPPPVGSFAYVAVGNEFSCAIRATDGGLECWGGSSFNETSSPAGAFVRVACGDAYACGIHAVDGTIQCWAARAAQQHAPPGSFVELGCILGYCCALATGSMSPSCWGDGGPGQPPPRSYFAAGMWVVSNAGPRGWSNSTGWWPSAPGTLAQLDPTTIQSIVVSPTIGSQVTCVVLTNHTMVCDTTNLATENTYGQFNPPGLEVGALAPQFYYKLGNQVRPCPLGTFSLSAGAITPLCSGPCAIGRYGNSSQQTSDQCTDLCSYGHYCPAGRPLPCKAGRFGASQGLVDSKCSGECPLGAFCPEGTSFSSDHPCPPGRFGNATGLGDSACSGECAPGYWCPAGSTSATQLPCGSASVYCPAGKGEPLPLDLGMIGADSADSTVPTRTQSAQSPCPAGSYCDGSGSARPCALGTAQNQIGQSECEPCAVGRYAPVSNMTECSECLPGQVSDAPGLSVCTSCAPGRTNGVDPASGLAVCDACKAGTASEGGTACTPCPPGSFSGADSSIFCSPCEAGSAQPLPGQSTCAACLPGSFTSGFNNTACAPCMAGSFTTAHRATSCTPCPQGTASAVNGSSVPCISCPAQMYQGTVGSTECLTCPENRFSHSGASVCFQIACGPQEQANSAGDCESCPLGQTSNGGAQDACGYCGLNTYTPFRGSGCVSCTRSGMDGLTCAAGLASVRAGYWAYPVLDADLSMVVFHTAECPPHYCPGAALQSADGVTPEPATVSNVTRSVVQCAPPRSDAGGAVLCGGCEVEYVSWNGSCVSCASVNGGLVFLYLVLSFALVLFLLRSGSTNSNPSSAESSGFTVILLYFVQTALLQMGPVGSWLSWLDVFNFGSSSFSTCLGPLSPYQQVQLNIFTPLILLGELGVLALVHRAVHSSQWAKRVFPDRSSSRVAAYFHSVASRFSWSSYVGGCVSILLFCYTQVATSCLEYLYCISVSDWRIVFSWPSLDCDSSAYRAHRVSVLAILALYIAGFPVSVLAFLWYRRSRQSRLQQRLAANSRDEPLLTGADFDHALTTSPSIGGSSSIQPPTSDSIAASHSRAFGASLSFVSRWGPLFVMYRPGAWYWQVSVLARRTLFVMVSVVAAQSPGVKYLAFALLNLCGLLTQLVASPFTSALLNRCEAVVHVALQVIAIALMQHPPPYSIGLQVVLFALVVPYASVLLVLALKGHVVAVGKKLRGRSTTDMTRTNDEEEDVSNEQNGGTVHPAATSPVVACSPHSAAHASPSASGFETAPMPMTPHSVPAEMRPLGRIDVDSMYDGVDSMTL